MLNETTTKEPDMIAIPDEYWPMWWKRLDQHARRKHPYLGRQAREQAEREMKRAAEQ